jgi:hypothetical protein
MSWGIPYRFNVLNGQATDLCPRRRYYYMVLPQLTRRGVPSWAKFHPKLGNIDEWTRPVSSTSVGDPLHEPDSGHVRKCAHAQYLNFLKYFTASVLKY